jgi:hypothetical protein
MQETNIQISCISGCKGDFFDKEHILILRRCQLHPISTKKKRIALGHYGRTQSKKESRITKEKKHLATVIYFLKQQY